MTWNDDCPECGRPMKVKAADCSVYVARDPDGTVLYVGQTGRGAQRLEQHSSVMLGWWSEASSITLEHFGTRDEALRRERHLIREHEPWYNKADNPAWFRKMREAGA